MVYDVASLPRDPDILIEMIAGLRDENAKPRGMLETLKRALRWTPSVGQELG